MFLTRSFNETQSARGQRRAVSWSQWVLQLQGNLSAAQTTRERWVTLQPSHHFTKKASISLFLVTTNVKSKLILYSPYKWMSFTEFVSLCRWWSSTASRVRQPCVWTVQRASTGSMWLFLCGTLWSSIRLHWRHSWMQYRAGADLIPG